jgi:hypothetical protein
LPSLRLAAICADPRRRPAVPHRGVPLAHFVELFSLPRKMQSSSPLSILKPKQIKAPSVLLPIARSSRSYPLQSATQAFFLVSISTRPSKEQAADVLLGFSPLPSVLCPLCIAAASCSPLPPSAVDARSNRQNKSVHTRHFCEPTKGVVFPSMVAGAAVQPPQKFDLLLLQPGKCAMVMKPTLTRASSHPVGVRAFA